MTFLAATSWPDAAIAIAEELAQMQRETTAELQKANEALLQLRGQTQELETGLKELDRILKAVE